jgi:hypothetical protein
MLLTLLVRVKVYRHLGKQLGYYCKVNISFLELSKCMLRFLFKRSENVGPNTCIKMFTESLMVAPT